MRKKVFICCGNCKEFEPSKKTEGYGHCPAIYWPYNILNISNQWFCKEFQLIKGLRQTYKPDRKTETKDRDIIRYLEKRGIKRGPGLISDAVMLT